MAGNREALAIYAGAAMTDPTLGGRLGSIAKPTLVAWGEADRIADTAYGRALAELIPGAEFLVIPETGHLPQLEQPEAVAKAVSGFLGGRAAQPLRCRPE